MIKYLSVSSINTYDNCPRMWKYQYLDKEMQLPSKALEIGKFVHEGIEALNNGKSFDDIVKVMKKKILFNLDKENVEMFRLVRRCIDSYNKYPVLGHTTIGNELECKYYLNNSKGETIEIPFLGYIDRLTDKGIIEYKTTSEDYVQETIDTSFQGTIYSFFHLKRQDKLPEEIVYWVVNKKKIIAQNDYKPQIMRTKRTMEDIDKAFDHTKEVLSKIQNEEFNVKTGDTCFWCPFRKICPRI